MKLIIIIMTTALLSASAASFGQKVTLSEKNSTLEAVLKKIQFQTGKDIVVMDYLFDRAKKVNITTKNTDLEETLNHIFETQPLTYEITGNAIIVKKKEKTLIEKLGDYFANIDVYGKVVDENGAPLGGTTITIKATGKGVTAKADGSFSMANIEEGTTLVITFMGYSPKEIKAARELGTIQLEPSTSKLDEVQIQAYGQTTQRTTVSNISTIKADEIEKQNVTNPLLAIQGRVPGLTIQPVSGLPNSGVSVRLFGQSSFGAGQDPLYVVDGTPYPSQTVNASAYGNPLGNSYGSSGTYFIGGAGNPMSFLNPLDIESIDVLKDASATAIYGSRAANGAIIITTKKGKAGRMKLDLNLENGKSIIANNLKMFNADDYVMMRKEAFRNDNIVPNADNAYDILNLYGWSNFRTTDWQRELISKSAQYTSGTLSLSGGSETTNYLFSGTYRKQEASIPGDFKDQKGSLHVNLGTSSKNQKFKLQFNSSYLYDQNMLPMGGNDVLGAALTLPPTAPTIYKSDQTINWGINDNGFSTWSNPLANLQNTFRNRTSNFISGLDLSYQLLDKLRLSLHSGYNNITSKEFVGIRGTSLPPEADFSTARTGFFSTTFQNNFILEPQLNFSQNIGRGKLSVLIGGTINQKSETGISEGRYGYSSDNMLENRLLGPYGGISQDIDAQYKYAAVFSRVSYNLFDKYLIELSGRRDGSSRFGPENRFHSFGALGLGWVFSEERFFKNGPQFISFGKLRYSYGTTGNDQISDYTYLDLVGNPGIDYPYQQIGVLQPSKLFNPDLQWEETIKANYGLDIAFFKDKISLSLDYSRNISGNNLSALVIPYVTGFNSVNYNFDAKIQNTSWQFNLTSNNLHSKVFTWKTGLTASINRNKLVALPIGLPGNYLVGQPLDAFANRFYDFAGIDPLSGRTLYTTSQGGLTFSPTNTDASYINLNPKWTGGINNNLSYKGFQLDLFLSIVNKKSIGYFGNAFGGGVFGLNVPEISVNRWQQPGDTAFLRRYGTELGNNFRDDNFARSTGNIINGSFIKLRSASVSWSAPKKLLSKINFQALNFYVQGQNLFSLSAYQGFDPETGINIPPTRIITVGLRASL